MTGRRASLAVGILSVSILTQAMAPWNLDRTQAAVLVEGLRTYPYVSYAAISGSLGNDYASGVANPSQELDQTALFHSGPLKQDFLGYLDIQVDRSKMVADILMAIRQALLF